MLSFWEEKEFTPYDFIVVGAGITGLSTAAVLAETQPNRRILVLERGLLPTGASTKNAGFASFGSLSEIVTDLRNMPEHEVFNLVKLRYEGLQKLQARISQKQMNMDMWGGYELLSEHEVLFLDHISRINDLLRPIFSDDVFRIVDDKIKEFGFSKKQVKRMLFNPFEAQLDTGKLMWNLLNYVSSRGVVILTGCELQSFEDTGRKVYLKVKNPYAEEPIWFNAPKVAFCTNAFTKKLIPTLEMEPGRGQVIVTTPINNLPFHGNFHFGEGLYYFRNVGNRVLFGGGRNLDFNNEKTTQLSTTELIINDLETKLQEIILPNQSYEITDRWSGIMAFSKVKKTIVQMHSQNIALGVRAGGMGMALGSAIGEQIAQLLLE